MPEITEKDARTWGMVCHLAALAFYVLPTAGHLLGPLAVWLMKRGEIPLVDEQGKESLNFQISVTLYALIVSPTICLAGLGFFLLGAIAIAQVVLVIVAAVKVNNGIPFQYPLTIRFLK